MTAREEEREERVLGRDVLGQKGRQRVRLLESMNKSVVIPHYECMGTNHVVNADEGETCCTRERLRSTRAN